jgi:hypothetical protein
MWTTACLYIDASSMSARLTMSVAIVPCPAMLPRALLVVLVFTAVQPGAALASTQEEKTLASAPAPHQLYTGIGSRVKVHRARLDGYFVPKSGHDAALAQLKKDVEHCLATNRSPAGLKRITEWPTYMMSSRVDEYMAANRSIRYQSGVGYIMLPNTCGLMGEIVFTATLESANGICQIDLVKKIAEGDCDPAGHANAPIAPRPTMSAEETMKRMAANPAMAPAVAQMKAMREFQPMRTGEHRIVLGARCDVWRQKLQGTSDIATICYASGASFVAAGAPEDGGPGGLALDIDNMLGLRQQAVDVKLDTEVSSAVFTPYNAAGFTIEMRTP